MKEHIHEYKKRLEDKIGEYMKECPASGKYLDAIKGMTECWMCMDDAEKRMGGSADPVTYGSDFSAKEATDWNAGMVNSDGTHGGHWSVDQTTAVAKSYGVMFDHIDASDWNVAMNMMYSDYYKVAQKYGVNTPEFYACMAKAFLFDEDGPGPLKKLGAYYRYIVK